MNERFETAVQVIAFAAFMAATVTIVAKRMRTCEGPGSEANAESEWVAQADAWPAGAVFHFHAGF
jgi:hypothetical protein